MAAPVTFTRPQEHPLGETHERLLFDYMSELEDSQRNKGVIRLHMSRLASRYRDAHTLSTVEEMFADIVNTKSAMLFRLHNTDVILSFDKEVIVDVEQALERLHKLVGTDELLKFYKGELRKSRLCSWFDMSKDYDRLLDFARKQSAKAGGRTKKTFDDLVNDREKRRQRRDMGRPMTPHDLHRIEEALVRADLSSHVRRQSVVAIPEAAHSPEHVYTEIFVGIGDLAETLMPNVDFTHNPWLFQHLTQTLDKRVLSTLVRRDDKTLQEGFGVNLNVATILSDDFMRFDDNLSPAAISSIVIEIRVEDIFSDPSSFRFARDFVQNRGYRICIDGLTPDAYRFADNTRLGVNLSKIYWNKAMAAQLGSRVGLKLKQAITSRKFGRVILAHVDSEAAIAAGQSIGINLFQGRYIDQMLRDASV